MSDFRYDPFTGGIGSLTPVNTFTADSILTHEKDQFGDKLKYFNPTRAIYFEKDFEIVFDNEGNVVTK